MANVSRTIDVIFNGKDSLSPTTKGVLKGLKALEAGVDKTIEKADILADKFKQTALAATALGATLLGLALNEYKKYQDAWTDLVKVTEGGEDALTGVTDSIREISRHYGEDITEITKSMFEFKRSGLDVADALLVTENAMKLVIAGNAEMGESTQFLKQIMAGFKLEAEDTNHVVDVLNIISDKYNTTVTELGIALSRISPSAEKMNISLDRTAALVTPIIEVFGSGEEASTAYRRGMLRLVNESPAVVKALSDLGVTQREGPNKTLREGNEILSDYINAIKDKTKQEQLSYLTLLFGERQASKLAESIGQLAKVTEIELITAEVKAQYTTDQVNIKLNTLKTTMGRLISSTKDLGISFGYELEDGARGAIGGITDLINSIGDAARDGLFDEVFDQFTDLGAKLGDYFTKIGAALPKALEAIDYSGLISAVEDLLGTINASFEGLDLTKPEDLAKAIQFVVDTMESGISVADGMITTYRNVKNNILSLVKVFNSLSEGQKKTFGETLAVADVMEKVGKLFGVLLTKMETFANISTGTATATAGLFRLLGSELELFGNVAENVWLGIRLLVLRSLNFITRGASKAVTEALAEVTKSYNQNKKEMLDATREMTVGYNQIVNGLDNVGTASDDATSKMKSFIDALAKAPKKVTVDIEANVDETTIDPAVAKIADEIEKAHAKQQSLGKFQLATKVEMEEEKDLQDFLQGKGKWTPRKDSIFDDSAIAKIEAQSLSLKRDIAAVAEAGKELPIDELDVPDDTKFKAAQDKLLKEIDTNAKLMETKVTASADVAEANAATISSAFDSVGDSITSTGDLLTDLYERLSSGRLDIIEQSKIERQVKAEEERRQEAFDLQKQLTTAQIDLVKQRASALAAGDPAITISGDGLQPHLEAFMWEILSAIQVRVNEDYGNFLLGIGA